MKKLILATLLASFLTLAPVSVAADDDPPVYGAPAVAEIIPIEPDAHAVAENEPPLPWVYRVA